MDGEDIVRLFEARDERAVSAAQKEYRSYLMKIAENITGSHEDAEECVNDALLRAWELIPPAKPVKLSAYLGKLARNLAITRKRQYLTEKRGGGEVCLVIDELSDIVSGKDNVEQAHERRELMSEISGFLKKQRERTRDIFICRYWYCMSVSELTEQFCVSENSVSVTLSRTRAKLKEYLQKRGYDI